MTLPATGLTAVSARLANSGGKARPGRVTQAGNRQVRRRVAS